MLHEAGGQVKKPELLAPAGGWNSLVAAVQNGADAVYLGGKSFNARQGAENFDLEKLARAVEYAHVRGVKVYVTVNTLLADGELEEAASHLLYLHNIGADAVIVQDLGLVYFLRKYLPSLEVHASTQMTVHNTLTIETLKEAGIRRIVLARELSLGEIAAIKRNTGMEIEVFIHGALCICYSGQCLLSSMIGGRSGNRGRCAQPCRLEYILVDEKGRPLADPEKTGRHLLSPRDLNLSRHIPELIAAGVNAFKIEGRLKRPEYVATVVRIYRKLIDRAMEAESYKVTREEARELAQVFNRGFAPGYLHGRLGRSLMSYKRPNNRGIKLGRVRGYDARNGFVEIKLEETLASGDILEIWVSRGGYARVNVKKILVNGKVVRRAEAGTVVRIQLHKPGASKGAGKRKGTPVFGDRVFKVFDASLHERARKSYKSPRELKNIPVKFHVTARLGEPLKIYVEDPDGSSGRAETSTVCCPAEKRPLNRDFLYRQLNRLGNTPFVLRELHCDLDKGAQPGRGVMVPVGEINKARREAIEELKKNRIEVRKRKPIVPEEFNKRLKKSLAETFMDNYIENEAGGRIKGRLKKIDLSVTVTDLNSLKAAVNAGADMVYFGGESFHSKGAVSTADIWSGIEYCRNNGKLMILSSSRVLKDGELKDFCHIMEQAVKRGVSGVQAGNLGVLRLARRIGLPVYVDFALNVFNRFIVDYLQELGAVGITLSPEMTLRQVKKIAELRVKSDSCAPALEVLVHGAVPLMISEYCPVGSLLGGLDDGSTCAGPCSGINCGLKDRMGVVFPIEVDSNCRMHIFNSRELCMIDGLGALAEAGVDIVRVEARKEGPAYVAETVKAYRLVLDWITGARTGPGIQKRAKETVARYIDEDNNGGRYKYTKGYYYRGV